MTRQESDKLAAHILDEIAESICDLTPWDADDILDEIVSRLNTPRTRAMLLPDEPEPALTETTHPSLSVGERNSTGVFACQ